MEQDLTFAIKARDEASAALNSVKQSTSGVKDALRQLGIAFTAVGAAGLKMVADARQINAQLSSTAITIGATTKELRNLTLETTNVTFRIKSVVSTFDILARAGVRNIEDLRRSANAFDALADATGSSAEIVADILIPALRAMGEQIPTTSNEMDKFTWLVKNTTTDLTEFGSVMDYVAMYGSSLNITLDEMIAIMAALEAKGKGGATATRLFRTAVSQAADSSVTLIEALDLTNEEIDKYQKEIKDATGLTNEHADAMNTQYSIMAKVKQAWDEMTFAAGSFLEPLEPILLAITALGPLLLFASTAAGKATMSFIAMGWAMLSSPIGLIITAVAALTAGIVALALNWDKVTYKFRVGAADMSYQMQRVALDVERRSSELIASLEDAYYNWKTSQQAAVNDITRTLSSLMQFETKLHNQRISNLHEETLAQLGAVDSQTAIRLAALQDESDILTDQMEDRRRAAEDEVDQARIAELERRISFELSGTKRKEMEQELADVLAEIEQRRWERQQQDRQKAIYREMLQVQQAAEDEKDKIQEVADTKESSLQAQYDDQMTYLQKQIDITELRFGDLQTVYQKDIDAWKKTLASKYDLTEQFLQNTIDQYNRIMEALGSPTRYELPPPTYEEQMERGVFGYPMLPGFQSGGVISEPTLLTRLRDMVPYATMAEVRPERIVPTGGMQSQTSSIVNISFPISQLIVREEADIDKISQRLYSKFRYASMRAGL